jgi:hypothetical protein
MRGDDDHRDHMFSYSSPERRVPPGHLLRPICRIMNQALRGLWPEFYAMDFHAEQRRNDTYASSTDPEAKSQPYYTKLQSIDN